VQLFPKQGMSVASKKSKSCSKIAVVVGHHKRCPDKQTKSQSALTSVKGKGYNMTVHSIVQVYLQMEWIITFLLQQ